MPPGRYLVSGVIIDRPLQTSDAGLLQRHAGDRQGSSDGRVYCDLLIARLPVGSLSGHGVNRRPLPAAGRQRTMPQNGQRQILLRTLI